MVRGPSARAYRHCGRLLGGRAAHMIPCAEERRTGARRCGCAAAYSQGGCGGMSRAQIAQLWALQLLDSEIERHKAESDALRRALSDDTTAAARATLAESARAARERARGVREAEAALDNIQTRLKRNEARLYGGGAPKELSALQQEI